MSKMQSIHQIQTQKPVAKKAEKQQKSPVKKAQMLEAPETMRPDEIRAAQQELGNEVVQRALDRSGRHASLTDEQGNLHREISDQIQQKRGGGSPLPEKVKQEASRKLGRKFDDVHIHTDESADKLSRAIHSRAFTIGKDIFFKNGVFSPASTSGRETILHELTHVVQQSGKGSGSGKLKLGAPDTVHEQEADRLGKTLGSAVIAGSTREAAQSQAGSFVQRDGDDELVPPPSSSTPVPSSTETSSSSSSDASPLRSSPSSLHTGLTPTEMTEMTPPPATALSPMEDIQAQGEEEEIQGQPENVVQRGPEEEEEQIQAQPDHGIVQAQPENVVQRGDEDEEEQPGVPPAPKMTPKMQLENLSHAAHEYLNPPKKPSFGEKVKGAFSGAKRAIQTKITGVDPESLQGQLQAQKKQLKHVKGHGISDIEESQTAKLKEQTQMDESGKKRKFAHMPTAAEKKEESRKKLMSTISDTSSKPEDVKTAQEKLSMLHKRSFKDRVKGFFSKGGTSKGYAEQAQAMRRKNLTKAAEGGDNNAFKELKEMKAEKAKNSTWGKIKGAVGGLAGKLGGLIGGQVKSMATDKFKEAKAHYMGPDKKEEDDKESKKGEKGDSGKSSSNSNAGIGAMMEKYGELVKENMSLKQKIAELEKAK